MSGKTGIFTNFLYDDKINEMATGHQILSESEGLIMLYAV
ncbi:MAG TPA: glycoside hydrolase, partial [Tepidanaerobacter syntrophicus]|nr:glycoside hydrolase [Tepidanaerobacter syntrophicus]